MYWASTYFSEVKGVAPELAAQLASLFYIGMTVGRFISGFIADKLGDRTMIRVGAGILVCGIALLFVPVGGALPIAAFIVIGLGCGPIYPCIIHSTPALFGADRSGPIIGIQMASAYVGSTFLPPLFGLLGNAIDFAIMPAYLLVFVLLMAAMLELLFKRAGRSGTPPLPAAKSG